MRMNFHCDGVDCCQMKNIRVELFDVVLQNDSCIDLHERSKVGIVK